LRHAASQGRPAPLGRQPSTRPLLSSKPTKAVHMEINQDTVQNVGQLVGHALVVLVLAFAVYLAWCYSRGRTGRVPLYLLPAAITLALPVAAIAKLAGL